MARRRLCGHERAARISSETEVIVCFLFSRGLSQLLPFVGAVEEYVLTL